jgi:ankyrin repeat protein
VNQDDNQPLHCACLEGHLETVKLMVSHGANVDEIGNFGITPLHLAAAGEKDCPELCEILLQHKAKIDAVNQDDNQPLHCACLEGHLETVKLMVSHGANVDEIGNFGMINTPLHLAALGEKDCPELCEILLQHKAKIDAVDQHGRQPLHWACQKCHLETVKLMVSHGANVDAVNNFGNTPLHLAALGEKDCPEYLAALGEKDCPELCEILLQHNWRERLS